MVVVVVVVLEELLLLVVVGLVLVQLIVVVLVVVIVALVLATSASITSLLFSLVESHCGNILPTFFELIDGGAYQHVISPHNFFDSGRDSWVAG